VETNCERARHEMTSDAIHDDDDAHADSLRDRWKPLELVARCFGSAEEFLESGCTASACR